MRLLKIGDGKFSFQLFFGEDTPRYAILSHTWAEEEVSIQNIKEGTGMDKKGYEKLIYCGTQAAKDGLQFFWMDTCCIDKSNSTELSEAINSMFRWYERSTKCYVYLPDVSVDNSFESELVAFRQARWFTRGWTLPELLAPKRVEFFSAEWNRLGDKVSLAQEIYWITRIPIRALGGDPLSGFSISERMSWAEKRETARKEDAAYSLLGIFGVCMPLLYGEGRRNAFIRLQQKILKSIGASCTLSQYQDLVKEIDLVFDPKTRESIQTDIDHISTTIRFNAEMENILDTYSDAGTDIASIFSDGGLSTSSMSTASLNPVQTIGIQEISRALLNQEELKVLYIKAVQNVERSKACAHIRGFLKEYGRNLLRETSNNSLEIQAAKFVQELAGRIAIEIIWSITATEFAEVPPSPERGIAKRDLENWLSSLQPENPRVEKEVTPLGPVGSGEDEEDDSDEEIDSDLQLPNIDKVKSFLLNSEALNTHIEAMRAWLKVDDAHTKRVEPPGNGPANTDTDEVIEESPTESSAPSPGQIESCGEPSIEVTTDPQEDTAEEQKSIWGLWSRYRHNRGSLTDMISGLLNYWGVYFYFYDLIELLVPSVRPGWKRVWWRCSCNTFLWGDFPVDDDSALDLLKRELSCASSGGTSMSRPNAHSSTSGSGGIDLRPTQSLGPSLELRGVQSTNVNKPSLNVSDPATSGANHIVNIAFSPKYFEVCINIGNHAIDHHEIDISSVTSDGELFELIWDKYNSSRGIGLRRLFLRPRDIDFVMFSISRQTQYGAGIHKRPDEFPPQEELNEDRYHYLCPKIRMPVSVFLHYLHRARWNIWGEHTEDTWLQRLPKKLKESVLADQEPITDPNLAFGWGIHIREGPNHAVLSLLLLIGITVAFAVSVMVVGFAKTQEQGFGVGNFLLTIIASIMAAVYFHLQDQ